MLRVFLLRFVVSVTNKMIANCFGPGGCGNKQSRNSSVGKLVKPRRSVSRRIVEFYLVHL